jgi:hypothetical protein
MVFGAAPSLSSDGVIQEAIRSSIYDILGAYAGNGGPKSNMFTSNPNASIINLGTGFDVDGNLGGNGVNSGVEILTAAQVLYDLNKAKDGRYEFGEIVLTFSRPVINPVIHFAGLGGSYRYLPFGLSDVPANYKTSFFSSELELQTPGFTSIQLSANPNFDLSGNNILNKALKPNGGSFPQAGIFDDYGAATGSVKIVGTVTQLVYKVFLRGSALSDMNFSTLGNNVTCGAARCGHNPFTGDQWYISASLDKPTQQISGNVFHDKDGLTDNNINQSRGLPNGKENLGGSLHANLLNSAGLVVASVPVNVAGLYLFDKVPVGTYSVQLTTNASSGTYAAPAVAPPTELTPGWKNTGEFIGNTVGNDNNPNGISSSFVVNPTDAKVEVNFGIEFLPETYTVSIFIPTPQLNAVLTLTGIVPGTGPGTGLPAVIMPELIGSDKEDQPTPGSLNNKKVQITTLPNNSQLLYGGNPVTLGQIIPNYNPSLLQIKFTIATATGTTQFSYVYIDSAGLPDPTPADYIISWPNNGPLPIILADFAAVKNSCNANLNWKTSSEIDSEKFEIEYSTTTNTKFEAVGTVTASGNSSSMKSYQFNYAMESGVVYYFRLKMYKKDGSFTYSEIKSLTCTNTKSSIAIVPNPL